MPLTLPANDDLLAPETRTAALARCAAELTADPTFCAGLLTEWAKVADADGQPATLRSYFLAALLAQSAPALPPDLRQAASRATIGFLELAADRNADFDLEIGVRVLGRLGPAVLPDVFAALARDRTGRGAWFHLWEVVELVFETPDPKIRGQALSLAMQTLIRADQDKIDIGLTLAAAHIVARLGHTDAFDLILRLRNAFDEIGQADLDQALDHLEGKPTPYDDYPPPWRDPVEEWLNEDSAAAIKWFNNPNPDDDDDDDDGDDEYDDDEYDEDESNDQESEPN